MKIPFANLEGVRNNNKAMNIPGATEGLLVAAQDQALHNEHHILYLHVSPTCHVCSAGLETVDHIVAGYSIFRFQWRLSRWYKHQPDSLGKMDDIMVMWDIIIPTARKIKAN